MRIIKSFVVLFCPYCLIAFACDKPLVIGNPPNMETNLEILWHKSFHFDSVGEYYVDPFFFGDYVILGSYIWPHYGKQLGIQVYHKQTGKRHSAWDHEPGGIVDMNDSINDYCIGGLSKDILFVANVRRVYAIDLNTGQRLWKLNIGSGYPVNRFSTMGIYPVLNYGPHALSTSWYRIAKYHPSTGERVDLVQLQMEDNYEFLINPPGWWVNENGDTLLFFTTSGWNFPKVDGRVHAYCYNLTQKQMLWANKNFTKDKDATEFQPSPLVIENNKVIITSLRAIHCVDRTTGNVVWQHEDLDFADAPYLYHEGKIYARSGNPSTLLCYDAQTGQQLWVNTTLNPLPAPNGCMDIYKDKLYLTAWFGENAMIGLLCVDIQTGKLLWRDRGPVGEVSGGVLIDQKTGYLYCHSDYTMMCVDLNKTPNGKNKQE